MTVYEAVEQSIVVDDFASLMAHLEKHYDFWKPSVSNVTCEHYAYDDRIEWNTFLICVNGNAALFADGPMSGLRMSQGCSAP